MNAAVIAGHTFREARRDRVLVAALGAGGALLVATQLLSPLALGEGMRLTVDLGLSGLSFIGLTLVILVGTSQVAREVDRRTIFHVLSRPVSRRTVLFGKWAGLSATLWVLAFGMGAALAVLLALRGHAEQAPAIGEAAYLAGLELTVMTAVAVMFSSLSTPVLSALLTLGMFVVGQWSYDLRAFAAHFPPALAALCNAAANLVPNLPLFNMRTLAAGGHLTTPLHLALATLYALAYSAGALALATAAFETRDLK